VWYVAFAEIVKIVRTVWYVENVKIAKMTGVLKILKWSKSWYVKQKMLVMIMQSIVNLKIIYQSI
jgi:hypothetical protein